MYAIEVCNLFMASPFWLQVCIVAVSGQFLTYILKVYMCPFDYTAFGVNVNIGRVHACRSDQLNGHDYIN